MLILFLNKSNKGGRGGSEEAAQKKNTKQQANLS